MTRLWTPNRPPFYMAPYGALVAACRPKMQQPAAAFSPLDVAGLQLWLKADAGLYQDAAMTTPAVLDTDPVGGWADQSGQNNHATQATAGSRPTLKLAIQNSRSVVRFDGTDDILLLGDVLDSVFAVADAKFTLFAIAQNANIANTLLILTKLGDSNQSENQRQLLWRVVSDKIQLVSYFLLNGNAYRGASGSTNVGTAFRVLSTVYDGSLDTNDGLDRFAHFVDSSSETETLSLTLGSLGDIPGGTAQVALGGTYGTAGPATFMKPCDIGEIIVYNSALSTANRQAVEAYLNSRWAVY